MERLRGGIIRGWAGFLDRVVERMYSQALDYAELEADGMSPSRGRVPEERKPVVKEEPEQIPE